MLLLISVPKTPTLFSAPDLGTFLQTRNANAHTYHTHIGKPGQMLLQEKSISLHFENIKLKKLFIRQGL